MQERTAAFGGTVLNEKTYNIVLKHNFMFFLQNGTGLLLGEFFNAATNCRFRWYIIEKKEKKKTYNIVSKHNFTFFCAYWGQKASGVFI